MDKTAYIAIIVEGFDREPQIVNNMLSIYFKPERFRIISFPAEQNIYMLWNLLRKDDYETDVIEVIREYSPCAANVLNGLSRSDFSEIYLFFDYDGHQQNLPRNLITSDVLQNMLDTFNNETELGKLYISYPMAEALRDYIPEQCTPATSCFWSLDCISDYKYKTGMKSQFTHITRYQHPDWVSIMNVFIMRVSCLFQKEGVFTFEDYQQIVCPSSIFTQQHRYITRQEIFVLSAFPEFLLDYFKIDFWKTIIEYSKLRFDVCELYKHNP